MFSVALDVKYSELIEEHETPSIAIISKTGGRFKEMVEYARNYDNEWIFFFDIQLSGLRL